MIFKYLFSFFVLTLLPLVYVVRILKLLFFKSQNILLGIQPLISNKYWSKTLNEIGFNSTSVVIGTFTINNENDFDHIINSRFKFIVWTLRYLIFYDVHILSFRGGFIGKLPIRRMEPLILKMFRIKSIILGYGSDIHVYDRINHHSYIHTLSSFYPQSFLSRKLIVEALESWQKHANFVCFAMFFGNGFYRNDLLSPNILTFPVEKIVPKYHFKKNSKFCIVHSPNHRIIKGTEYISNTINKLKNDFDIEYILLEKRPNIEVLDILQNKADIFIEKLVGPSYALSAIEAMSFGVPVVGSVNNGDWNDLYKCLSRYSFVADCPIISANVESLEVILRDLLSFPEKLNSISAESRKYVERYHSFKAGGILFKEIIDCVYSDNKDLKNMYHPISGYYNDLFDEIE